MSDAQPPWPKVGMIASFLANADSVALGLPECDTTKKVACFSGEIVGVKSIKPYGRTRIPSAAVTIRGKTGKTVTIDGVACYLNVHASWADAQKRPIPIFP